MGIESHTGAEVNIGRNYDQIVFGDALSALSYNDWLQERAFKEASLVETRAYWDSICPCKIHYGNVPGPQKAATDCNSQGAPEVVPAANRALASANFALS